MIKFTIRMIKLKEWHLKEHILLDLRSSQMDHLRRVAHPYTLSLTPMWSTRMVSTLTNIQLCSTTRQPRSKLSSKSDSLLITSKKL
jgi:hypothetical protein